MENIYYFKSYKDVLKSHLKLLNKRGATLEMAEAAGCQSSYLSKVLQSGSKVQLTHDHLFGISEYMDLSENEAQFLRLLLEKERASQKKYKLKIEKEIEAIRNEFLKIKNVVKKESVQPATSIDETYYGHWLYSALHIAVSIPALQSLMALANHFFTPPEVLRRYLEHLEKFGLVARSGPEKWVWKSGDIHLSSESSLARLHQMNWHAKAVEESAYHHSDSVHYTVVQSLSTEDCERLRLVVLEWIKVFQKISSPSRPEELVNLNIDFYKVVRRGN